MPTTLRRPNARRRLQEAGTDSWRGMFTRADEAHAQPGIAHFLRNCRPMSALGGPIQSRPGIAGIDYSNPASNTVLAVFSFYTAAAVLITGRLVQDGAAGGAHLETFNWSTHVWTVRLSAAQINAAGLDLTGDWWVDWVPFHGTIVFSDGVNVPWTWDGTAGGGITKLTNAPVAYGKPTVYYGKLFVIKNTERDTIAWSEENQPNTGYEAGGYNNAWTLTQTSNAPLLAILGTNSALQFWRRNSAGAITGPATPDFASSGVTDAISGTVGCGDYRSVVRYGTSTWWMDQNGDFQVLPDGGAPQRVTPFSLRTSNLTTVDPFGFEAMGWVRPLPDGAFGPIECVAAAFTQSPATGAGAESGQVWFTLQGSTSRQWVGVLVFDAATHLAQGYYTFPTPLSHLDAVAGADAGQLMVFSTPNTTPGAANYLWAFGRGAIGAAAGGADATYNATAAISCTFMDAPLIAAPDIEFGVTQVDLATFVDTTQASTPAVTFGVRYVSSEYPTATVAPAALNLTNPASGTLSAYSDLHLAYGLFTVARWFRPVVQWDMGTGNLAFASGLKGLRTTFAVRASPPGLR